MPIRMTLMLSILTVSLAAGCQSKPPSLPVDITDRQQDELSAIYASVWRDTRAYRGSASKPRIHGLLATEDDRIRALLNDEQWEQFDTQTKEDWVNKLYRSTHQLHTTETGRYGPTTTPWSSTMSSGGDYGN